VISFVLSYTIWRRLSH